MIALRTCVKACLRHCSNGVLWLHLVAVVALFACSSASTDSVQPNASKPAALSLTWSIAKANNGVTFRSTPIVTVKTVAGAEIAEAGITVNAEVGSGTGRVIGNTVAVTRADGRAVFTDLAVQGYGAVALRFTAPGLVSVISPTFTLTEPAVALEVTQIPTFVPAGGALGSVHVAPTDAYHDLTREEGIVITAAVASGNGTLVGNTTATTDIGGIARFSSLTINGTGPHALRFTSPGLPTVTSGTINIGQRATALSITTQPEGAASGLAFTTQPRLQLRDIQGAAVQQRDIVVTASLARGTGGLSGTLTSVTNDLGVALFNDLAVVGTGEHVVRFTSPDLTGVTSNPLTLPPFALAFGLDQFVLVRAGSFDMGSDGGFLNERPVHRVTLTRDYYLQKTEVTQSQWGAVMGRNPSLNGACGGNCPVERITYADIQEFLRRLTVANPGVIFRLPSEAEWEYAARAGSGGEDPTAILNQAWHAGNSGGRTQQVAKRPANAWGLYDMVGNVAEWTSDWYDDYQPGSAIDPIGPRVGTQKVYRGGSWNLSASLIRIPARQFEAPDDLQFAVRSTLGLRLVRTQ